MGSIMKKWDTMGWGIAAGILGTLTGFFILAFWWSSENDTSLSYFVHTVFIESQLYKDSILTVSVLFNVALFWIALQSQWERFAKGVMLVILVSIPAILWIQGQSFFS